MPRPSTQTKYFLSMTILKLSRTKILSRVKKSIFSFQKSIKMKFPDWKCLENLFSTRNVHFEWLLKAKNGVFNHGQNFCPGQFQNCPGQKTFCPGRWTRHLSWKCHIFKEKFPLHFESNAINTWATWFVLLWVEKAK